jgi:hypothetical protein
VSGDSAPDERRLEQDASAERRTGFAKIWASAAARIAESGDQNGQVYSEGLVADEADAQAHDAPYDASRG